MRFLLKSIRSILCKVKKDDFIKKTRSFFYVKEKKKDFLKEDPHSYDEFITHASHS